MLGAGLLVTVNSDDPPYFGAYVNENLLQCQAALNLSVDEIVMLARNSIVGSFLPSQEVTKLTKKLDTYCAGFDWRN